MSRFRQNGALAPGSRRRGQRGVIFIAALVLLAGMSVVIIALASEVALDLRMATNLADTDEATEIARAGLDNVIYLANANNDWRTRFASGIWISNKILGGGTFTAWGIDPDGDLANCPIDSVTARATATYNGAARIVSATLRPPVHDSMMYLAYGSGWAQSIRFESTCRVYGDLCCQKAVLVSGSPDHRGHIYARALDQVSSGLVDANTDVIVWSTGPVLPVVNADWFFARGAQILPPLVGGIYEVADKRISPSSNPYGFTNSEGIYCLDAGGTEVRFVRCHITGTIVLKRAPKVTFDKACVHAPAFSYQPALVTDGSAVYSFDQNLSESQSNVDFNADGDKADTFSPSVSGIVYATTSITGLQASGGTNVVRFKGALVSNLVTFIGTGSIFEQDPSLATNLVNQFQGKGLTLVKGSVKYE